VRVQVARLEQRLAGLARWQAAQRHLGWRIEHGELKIDDQNLLQIPGGQPIRLRAKIDRIDVKDDTGERRILDYKSSDNPTTPHQVHHGGMKIRESWVDLQLPLYHLLARQRGMSGPVTLGFVVLPRDPQQVGDLMASWTDEHLQQAVDTAVEVVQGIRAGRFELNRRFEGFDEFDRICQTGAIGRASGPAPDPGSGVEDDE
jgi:hypothetical protein